MTRPTRTSSPSRKTISIRVTPAEHELLTKAAHPMYLSDWLRRLALESHEVRAITQTEDDAAEITDFRAAFAMLELRIRTVEAGTEAPDKKRAIQELGVSMRKLLGMVLSLIESTRPAQS
jgi:hypothetical protein